MQDPEKEPHDPSYGVNFNRYSHDGCEIVSTSGINEPLPRVFRDGDSWVCMLDPSQYPEFCAGFGDTEEEEVREHRRDMGMSEEEISKPVIEDEHFEYR